MPSRPDPERIATARREAILARIRGAGFPSDQAVALIVDAESQVLARGLDRLTREFWEAVSRAVDERLRR